MTLSARYFDGRTSRVEEVRLVFSEDGSVTLLGENREQAYALQDLDIAPRIGNTVRAILLPNGGKCEVRDNEALDRVLDRYRRAGWQHWVHRLESRWRHVLVAAAFTLGVCWVFVGFGIPWLAERAAHALPTSVVRSLGDGVLEVLDEYALAPTELEPATRQRLQDRFAAMRHFLGTDGDIRLVFRRGKLIGPNALALPSGVVVMTDELVELAENDDELIAILAHEIGHLQQRHSMRMVMQNSGVALVIAGITGDPFSSSALAAALPTMLIQARYSQAFETEADDFAYDYLVANQIPTRAFSDILTRIAGGDGDSASERYLSSHPPTRERIERFVTP